MLHPTLTASFGLALLRQNHRTLGPDLGRVARQIANASGVDAGLRVAQRAVAGVRSMVGADDSAVPDNGPVSTHDKGFMQIVTEAAALAGAPAPTFIHRTMSAGMQGDDVREWQAMLGIAQTSVFDSATVAATKAFQASKGLVADGIAGPKTIAAMFGENAALPPTETPAPSPAPAITPVPAPVLPPPAPAKKTATWKWIAGAAALAAAGIAVSVK